MDSDDELPYPAVPLRAQNASRFSWPLDLSNNWTYKMFSPEEISLNVVTMLGKVVTIKEVCESLLNGTDASSAYFDYVENYMNVMTNVCG